MSNVSFAQFVILGLTCTADNVTEDSILDWLFGFDPSCVEADDNHCSPPNVGTMLHALNYTWSSCQDYRGKFFM